MSAVDKQEEINEEGNFSYKSRNDSDLQRRRCLTPVTVLQAGPCVVTQVKTVENDGYDAVQVGFADIRKKKLVNKPVKGHFEKQEFLKEILKRVQV